MKRLLTYLREAGFDSNEPRDTRGEWTKTGAGSITSNRFDNKSSSDDNHGSNMKQARAHAERIYAKSSKAEPKVSQAVSNSLHPKAKLAGLEHRLKTEDSLIRKLFEESLQENITVEQKAATIKDALRYTMVIHHDHYVDGIDHAMQQMKKHGFTMVKAKNSWAKKDVHGRGPMNQDVNTAWKDKDGQMFELQFHTPESHDMKMLINHDLYERERLASTPELEKETLRAQMRKNHEKLSVPRGIEGKEWL